MITDDAAFLDLVDARADELAAFLGWAGRCEDQGRSLRLERRGDVERCRRLLGRFHAPWWGVVVYSCFDSSEGTEAVASAFAEPLPADAAEHALGRIRFPRGSVRDARAQATLTGAKTSLISACEKEADLEPVLAEPGTTFGERFEELTRIHVAWWGRTTNLDALIRGGTLAVDGVGYRPGRAYLRGSTGPAAGFARVWGIAVTGSNAGRCEELLVRWTRSWSIVVERLGVGWEGAPYDSADLENALCAFQQESRRAPRG